MKLNVISSPLQLGEPEALPPRNNSLTTKDPLAKKGVIVTVNGTVQEEPLVQPTSSRVWLEKSIEQIRIDSAVQQQAHQVCNFRSDQIDLQS